MAKQTIHRTHERPLEFDGELVIRTGANDGRQRGYQIEVYQTADGFVVVIRFQPGEGAAKPIVTAEVVEHRDDIEKVLFVFEPLEHFDSKYINSLNAEARQALTADLFRLYDHEVNHVLTAMGLASRWTTSPQSPPPVAADQSSGIAPTS